MGGRGASLRNRNNSVSKVRKGLGYVGKIQHQIVQVLQKSKMVNVFRLN